MIQKLKMIWWVIRDRQAVIITESYGILYCNWDARSLDDIYQMRQMTIDKAKEALYKKVKCMSINLTIFSIIADILILFGVYLHLKADDFKYGVLGFLLELIGLGIFCIIIYQNSI